MLKLIVTYQLLYEKVVSPALVGSIMRIGILVNAARLYGGTLYESMVKTALGCEHNVTLHNARPWISIGYRPQSFIRTAFAEVAS